MVYKKFINRILAEVLVTHIINGKEIAQNLRDSLKKEIAILKDTHNAVPGLAVVQIGSVAASSVYVKAKTKNANEVGIKVIDHHLEEEITQNQLLSIQHYFKSDIRSMINYIQSNHTNNTININVIKDNFWVKLLKKMSKKKEDVIKEYIYKKCIFFNIQPRQFVIKFFLYLIHNKKNILKREWLDEMEFILHNKNIKDRYIIDYTIVIIHNFIKEE